MPKQRKISRRSLPIFDPVVAASLENVEGDLQELYGELRIQRTDVPGEMQKQASLYGWWAVLLAEAEFDVDRTERALKLHAADRDHALRRGGGKVTEKGIENQIISEDEYVELHAVHLAARRTASILKYIVRSLEHRREMLVGLNMRDMREYQASS